MSLVSVYAKFQLSRWSRSGWKVWGAVVWVVAGSKWPLCLTSTLVTLSALSWVELGLGFDKYLQPQYHKICNENLSIENLSKILEKFITKFCNFCVNDRIFTEIIQLLNQKALYLQNSCMSI